MSVEPVLTIAAAACAVGIAYPALQRCWPASRSAAPCEPAVWGSGVIERSRRLVRGGT